MNESERNQIELIVAHDVELVRRAVDERLEAIFARHSAEGRLQSGSTIKVSVSAMQEIAEAFLRELGPKIEAVTGGADAFELLRIAVLDCLNDCAERMERILQMAKGGRLSSPPDSIELAGHKLFAQLRSDVEAKVEILQFDFLRGPPLGAETPPNVRPLSKTGGRPPAAFWDDMWASIATALYDGSLIPKTQADVETAMADWLEGEGHSAAASTIRARARRLWDRIALLDE